MDLLYRLMWLTPLRCWLGRGDMQREEQVPWAPADHWHWGCPALLIVKGKSMSLKAPRSQMLALAGGPCATQVQRQLCHPDGHQAPESQKSNQQGPDPDKAEYPRLSLGWANWNVPLSQGPLWPPPALGSPACHPRHLGQGQGSGEIPPAPSQCTLHHGHVSPLLLPAVCFRQGPASSRKTPCPSPAAPCFPP